MIANLLKILKHIWRKIRRCTVVGRCVLDSVSEHRKYLDEHPEYENQYIVFTFDANGHLKSVRYSSNIFRDDISRDSLNARVEEGNEYDENCIRE